MVDAGRRNPGSFDNLPHLVHQARTDFAVSLVLHNAADAVQVEPNRFLNDFDIHSDFLDLREVFLFAAFSLSSFTRSFTIRSIRSIGIGSSSEN